MGNWQLEVGRMFLYMMFPVVTFHYFNQPKYYEDWVTKVKQEMYPPESEEFNEQLRQTLIQIRKERELEDLKEQLAQIK